MLFRSIEVVELRSGVLGVSGKVEVGTVGDAFKLAPLAALETETVFDVDGALRIVRELLLGVLVETQVIRIDAEPDYLFLYKSNSRHGSA